MMTSQKDEKGFILVMTLFILFLITLLGMASTSTTSIELQVAYNNSLHKQQFYVAEGAVIEASRKIENVDDGIAPGNITNLCEDLDWVTCYSEAQIKEMRDIEKWVMDPNPDVEGDAGANAVQISPTISIAAVGPNLTMSSSQAMGSSVTPQIIPQYNFVIFGRYNKSDGHDRGEVLIEAGYRTN